MATHLDLEEQEQLDQLKAFWKRYGNLLTWLLVIVLGGIAAWNGWNWWQRDQAIKSGSMFDELDKAAQAGDADQVGRIFGDMKDRYPRTAFTEQGGLLAAKVQFYPVVLLEENLAGKLERLFVWLAVTILLHRHPVVQRPFNSDRPRNI